MNTFKAFPSIEQFRTVIKKVTSHARYVGLDDDGEAIFDPTKKAPVLKYKGTVKLHGTNACIHAGLGGEITYQSRNNIITPEKDNAGFANYMHCVDVPALFATFKHSDDVYIYGEWCGKGIQKGVGIAEIDKMFVIFDVVVNGERLEDISHISMPQHRIFNINDFPTWNIDIDFNDPQVIQNTLVSITEAVEQECPVAKHFGVSGVGEGVVWSLAEPFNGFPAKHSDFTFKVKGEKHSVSKVRTLASVDVEKVESVKEFVSNVVTENRLKQGVDWLKEQHIEASVENTGTFIRWIFADILKEEADVIIAAGLEERVLGGLISKAAKTWFFNNINE